MAVKKGQDFYRVSVNDEGKCELETHRISTINKNGIYLTEVNEFTWGNKKAAGKRFSKEKVVGWLPDIWTCWKNHCRDEEDLKSRGFHTTKLAAWKDPRNLKYLDEPEDAEIKLKAERAIKAAITRLKKEKETKKGKG